MISPQSEKPSQAHRPTAYLDGLRGFAALIVFSFHTIWAYSNFVEYGYGEGPANMRLVQLPFLRLLYAGHAMVPLFFVIGGYVMAIKPLKQLRARRAERGDLCAQLARSVFRKGMRLYLPAIASSFLAMLSLQVGFWEPPRRILRDPRYFNYADMHPPRMPHFRAEFWRWAASTAALGNIWTYVNKGFVLPYYDLYDPHLWTLPFEMRATLVVAITLLALSRFRPAVRVPLTFTVGILCLSFDRWECTLFIAGALLAELDLALPPPSPSSGSTPSRSATAVTTTLILLPSLYLLSAPNLRIAQTPGYKLLARTLVPACVSDPKRALHGLGAIGLVAALGRCPELQRPFVTRFARAAARRSFALYILHGPLMHTLGYGVTVQLWRMLGFEGASKDASALSWWLGTGSADDAARAMWLLGIAGGVAVLAPVVWCVAGWWESVLERRVCANVAGWAERRCFGGGRERERERGGDGEGGLLGR